jgi:hypothetical protein
MHKGSFAGKAMFNYRHSYTPRKWTALLMRSGFLDIEATVLDPPTEGRIGTLIVRAVCS